MYYVVKTLEISSSHQLYLDYESKCESQHGHNWMIKVYCRAKELDGNGMVCDFTDTRPDRPQEPERGAGFQPDSREHSALGGGDGATVLPRRGVGKPRQYGRI